MILTIFGCKSTTLFLGENLKKLGHSLELITISPEMSIKHSVADYADLSSFTHVFDNIHCVQSYNLEASEDESFFADNSLRQIGICIGWQRLIPEHVLACFQLGVFGMHGSARHLPAGRGRSPLNWSIIENQKWFITNLFRYDAGVDSGKIVAQETFSIQPEDNAQTLHFKNSIAMLELIKKNLDAIVSQKAVLVEQDSQAVSTYYPKRTTEDGIIDWRDNVFNIERLVRAVAPPFAGAFASLDNNLIKINRLSVFYTDLEMHPFLKEPPGKVLLCLAEQKFLVRCAGGVLLIHDYDGDCPNSGAQFDVMDSPFGRFNRNHYGFFDI